jgi:hypothetical protein
MNGLDAYERQYRTTLAVAMIARSVADILSHHVKLSVEGIDQMYLNIVSQLQHEQGIVAFFREHRGPPIPSGAEMSPISRNFVAKLEGCAAQHKIPMVQFRKGQHKDDVRSICANSTTRKALSFRRLRALSRSQGAHLSNPERLSPLPCAGASVPRSKSAARCRT